MNDTDRRLLESFVVENEDLEQLESRLAEFNIFEALGAVRQELRHSDFLAFLLDPSQNHGLGDGFLKRFLKRLLVEAADPPVSAVEIDVADLRGIAVRREWQNIDILAHDPGNGLVCAIENKIGSREHSEQLRRYRETVARDFPDHRTILVFLTPEGEQPSDEAFIPFDYARVAELVDAAREAHRSTLGPDVYALMTHYTAMLRRYIVSESEIAELCRRIYDRHKQALDLIYEHRPDIQWDVAELTKRLIAEAKTHDLVGDHTSKGYLRFAVAEWDTIPTLLAGQGWTRSGRILLFEFQNSPDQLSLRLIIGPGPDEVRQTAFQTTQQHPQVFRKGSKRLYTKWTTVYVRRFLTKGDYEDADFGALAEKVEKEWSRFLNQDLPAIRNAIADVEWPELPNSTG